MSVPSPWAEPLRALSPPEIRRRAAKAGPIIESLPAMSPEVGGQLLVQSLKQVHTPTEQTVTLTQKLLGICAAHAQVAYPSRTEFLEHIHSDQPPRTQHGGICLTGLAGVGKTSLIHALRRVIPVGATVDVGSGFAPFPVRTMVPLLIESAIGSVAVLRKLLKALEVRNPTGSCAGLEAEARLKLHRHGVSLLLADEMQFVTGSSSANTKATQLIYLLAGLGVPLVYGANFSLCHRLLRRPQEDQQRLFWDVCVLRPEPRDSADWVATLRDYLAVAPEVFAIDAQEHAPRLHELSHGLPGIAIKLIWLAYEHAAKSRRQVRIDDVEWAALKSDRFCAERGILEKLRRQALSNGPASSDLWCPFGTTNDVEAVNLAKEQLQTDMISSMLEQPRAVERRLPTTPPRTSPAKGAKAVTSIATKRTEKLDAGLRLFVESEVNPLNSRP